MQTAIAQAAANGHFGPVIFFGVGVISANLAGIWLLNRPISFTENRAKPYVISLVASFAPPVLAVVVAAFCGVPI